MALLGLTLGYLIGSTPFTWLLGHTRGVDLRRVGSGNVGSANLDSAAGRTVAVAGFFLDAGKGVAAAVVGGVWGEAGQALAAWGAIAGHAWPVWLRFVGGRAQTVTLTAGAVVAPWSTLAILPILGIGFFTKNLALSWPVAVVAWPVIAVFADGTAAAVYAVGAAVLTVVRRLVGSPRMERASLRMAWLSRLLYDREP